MKDFKAKLQQIRFRLELRPRPHSGSLPLAVFAGGFAAGGGLLGNRRERGRGSGGEGKGGLQVTVEPGPLREPCYATGRAAD